MAYAQPSIGSTSQGTRYQIKQNPGASFTITCSPSASVSGTGAVGPPVVTGSGSASVLYSASAAPLEVILSGGIGEKNSKKYLIGQRVGANLVTGGLTPNSFSFRWSVSGGEPFKNYTPIFSSTAPDSTSATFDEFAKDGNATTNPTGFYFKKPPGTGLSGTATVSCSAHLDVPAGAKPENGFDVTQSRPCTVDAPINELTAQIGTVQGVIAYGTPAPPDQNPVGMQLWGATYTNDSGAIRKAGIVWTGKVITPVGYGTSGSPGWNFTQTVKPSRTYFDTTKSYTLVPPNADYVLDSTFGYYPVIDEFPYLHPATDTLQKDNDSPAIPFPTSFIKATIQENFVTYTMYRPPGTDSVFVPLKSLTWFWQGTATVDAAGKWSISNAAQNVTPAVDFPLHPKWQGNITGAAWNPSHPQLQNP